MQTPQTPGMALSGGIKRMLPMLRMALLLGTVKITVAIQVVF